MCLVHWTDEGWWVLHANTWWHFLFVLVRGTMDHSWSFCGSIVFCCPIQFLLFVCSVGGVCIGHCQWIGCLSLFGRGCVLDDGSCVQTFAWALPWGMFHMIVSCWLIVCIVIVFLMVRPFLWIGLLYLYPPLYPNDLTEQGNVHWVDVWWIGMFYTATQLINWFDVVVVEFRWSLHQW